MIGVYRVNYTVIGEDHSFTDHFFCRDMIEIKSSLVALFNDYTVVHPMVTDGCIYGYGTNYDLMITIESTSIFDDKSLEALI